MARFSLSFLPLHTKNKTFVVYYTKGHLYYTQNGHFVNHFFTKRRKMKDAKPVVVPTVLTAKASADLAKEIEKDLDISDPEEEVAKAALEDASEDTNNNGGDSNGPEGKDN